MDFRRILLIALVIGLLALIGPVVTAGAMNGAGEWIGTFFRELGK